MDARRDVVARQADDLGNVLLRNLFEIEQDDLPVERRELPDMVVKLPDGAAPIHRLFRTRFALNERVQVCLGLLHRIARRPAGMGGSHVVRDPVYPGAQGRLATEGWQRPPQSQQDVLQQLAATFWSILVSGTQALQGGLPLIQEVLEELLPT